MWRLVQPAAAWLHAYGDKARARAEVPERGEGQGLTEYALIIALISLACIAILILMGPQITAAYSNALSALQLA